ncbi:MAG: citrate/2-methylcitrate synthase [Calditrichaeota bacterium]|nr:MAG: citrate/2-methylcitrate synthase [Calditrichota bacterium]
MNKPFVKGLAGVIVDETKISNVEGEFGRLSYRGYEVHELIEKQSFTETVWLVLFGEFPNPEQNSNLNKFLIENSELTNFETEILKSIPKETHPMLVLQSLVPILNLKPKSEITLPFNQAEAIQGLVVCAKIPSLVANFFRLKNGLDLVKNSDSNSVHENFLFTFNGKKPSEKEIKTLDATQVLQMEHSFNASTFAGRITASTLSPVQSMISAAIGTLYGKLHGGADEAALKMAQEIGSPEKAKDFVSNALAKKIKIMGMGHREYKTVDPRAKVLKPMAEELTKGTKFETEFQTLKAVENAMQVEMEKRQKEIWANVEFYKGAVFHTLGIPPEFFTTMFAMARSFGYLAHFLESRLDNKLIRPKAFYTGETIRKI